jgi:hypothetical protein
VLVAAGFSDVAVEPHTGSATVARDAIADQGQPAYFGVPEDRLADAEAAIDANLAPFAEGDGRYRVPLAFFVVTARA